jgi:hypothetical protein
MAMKRKIAIAGVALVLALGTSATLFVLGQGTASAAGKIADHSLFDQTGGDIGAACVGSGIFTFHVSARAINGDAAIRVGFQDGDFVDFPIADGQSFSVDQAAGDTLGVDRRLTIKSAPSSVGKLVGWVSAQRQPGTKTLVACKTLT